MIQSFYPEYAFWGGVGGLLSILTKCGYIELPSIKDHRVYLGGLQGVLFGVVAGLIGDTTWTNALMWGAGGTSIIQGLINTADKIAFEIKTAKRGDKN